MKKKMLNIIIWGILILSLTAGCTKEEVKQNNSSLNKTTQNSKEIVCIGAKEQTSQNEIEMSQSYKFHFNESDEITTFDLIQNMKLLKETSENKEQFNQQNEEYFKNYFKSMFEFANIDIPNFEVKVEVISTTEKNIIITFDYRKCIQLFAGKDDEDIIKYTSFEDFKNYVLKEITNNMTCTYDGKEIK